MLRLTVSRESGCRALRIVDSHQSLRALCVNTTMLDAGESSALSTIGSLEHLKICHSSMKWQTHHTPHTAALLHNNMNTLKSIDLRIGGNGAENTRNRFRLPLGAGSMTFPCLTSLAIAYPQVSPQQLDRRPEMASILSHFATGVDYSQLSTLVLNIDSEDLAILAAQMRKSLKLRDLSIDLRSPEHFHFLRSFDSLTSLKVTFLPAAMPWDSLEHGIVSHKGLKQLDIVPKVVDRRHWDNPSWTGLVGLLPNIFKSLPLLESITLGSGNQWLSAHELVSGSLTQTRYIDTVS